MNMINKITEDDVIKNIEYIISNIPTDYNNDMTMFISDNNFIIFLNFLIKKNHNFDYYFDGTKIQLNLKNIKLDVVTINRKKIIIKK